MSENKRRKLNGDEETALQWLLGKKCSTKEFFETYFGKKPLHLSRWDADERKEDLGGLFGVKSLLDIVGKKKLVYGLDMNVVNCPDKKKKKVVHKEGQVAKRKEIESFLKAKAGATIQFFQPQRFSGELWSKMEELECTFSSLWGANVYLTAAGTQGLAPHYDDVDVFVVQTEGTKKWKIHGTSEAFQEQALEYSEDLQSIGPLLMEVDMKPGDLLYLPRGTIHYAVAGAGKASVHITFSTHQQHSYYNLFDVALPKLADAAASTNVAFRRGLPVGYLKENGTWRTNRGKEPTTLVREVASLLRLMADEMESSNVDTDESLAQALHESVDSFAVDFMRSRLPPMDPECSAEETAAVDKKEVSASQMFRLTNPDRLHMMLASEDSDDLDDDGGMEEEEGGDDKEEDEDGDDDQDRPIDESEDGSEEGDENEEEALRIFFSFGNDRNTHMGPSIPQESQEALRLPFVDIDIAARPLLAELLQEYPKPISVEKSNSLDSDAKKSAVEWVKVLASKGIVKLM